MPGISLTDVLNRLPLQAISEIIGSSYYEALRGVFDDSEFKSAIVKVSVKKVSESPVTFLNRSVVRGFVLDALTEEKAKELARRCGSNEKVMRSEAFSEETDSLRNFAAFLGLYIEEERESIAPMSQAKCEPSYGLFEHQRAALKKLERATEGNRGRVLLHMPTGSGKTRTTMHMVCRHLYENDPGVVIWLASSGELLEQALDSFVSAWSVLGNRPLSFFRCYGDHGYDADSIGDGAVFAGLQKLNARTDLELMKLGAKATLVVFDEAHQAVAPTYERVASTLVYSGKSAAFVGLSATPGRTWSDIDEDERLAEFFNRKKVTLEVQGWANPVDYLIEQGYLAKPTFKSIQFSSAIDSECTGLNDNEEYSDRALCAVGEEALRNELILDEIQKLVDDGHQKIVYFAPSVENSEVISAVLCARGIKASSVSAETTRASRERIVREFRRDSNIPYILCNFGIFTTGFDAPKTSAAVIARPTKSLVLYSQMVGRAIRGPKAGGNSEARIVTVVDTNLPGFGAVSQAFENWEDVWSE